MESFIEVEGSVDDLNTTAIQTIQNVFGNIPECR